MKQEYEVTVVFALGMFIPGQILVDFSFRCTQRLLVGWLGFFYLKNMYNYE